MKRLPMPSASVTKKLVVATKQAWLDGFESVKYAHISTSVATHFPLWLVMFWSDVHELRTEIRGPWVKAKAWLAKEMLQKRSATR